MAACHLITQQPMASVLLITWQLISQWVMSIWSHDHLAANEKCHLITWHTYTEQPMVSVHFITRLLSIEQPMESVQLVTWLLLSSQWEVSVCPRDHVVLWQLCSCVVVTWHLASVQVQLLLSFPHFGIALDLVQFLEIKEARFCRKLLLRQIF